MRQLDIKERIDKNNNLIEKFMTPNKFVLNNMRIKSYKTNVSTNLKKVFVSIVIKWRKNNGIYYAIYNSLSSL